MCCANSALATGRVRHVGDPVAFIVADSAEIAREAAVLTAIKDVEDALVAYANERERQRALQEAEAAGASAFRLARDLGPEGAPFAVADVRGGCDAEAGNFRLHEVLQQIAVVAGDFDDEALAIQTELLHVAIARFA